ncbi:hypothetical protein HAX54_009017 [Datura stramonium]|uniref:Uncharacterized protein n=1 Tax=Datura stramonium TaxID=4076 RepID=A0ABS8WZ06_DATST|nr:hypothetical protein [Datura stramonium]
MITGDEEYDMRKTIVPIGNLEADSITSSVAPFIMVQLRVPLTIPKFLVTTIIINKLDYDSKEVLWDYRAEVKPKMIDTEAVHKMGKIGRCYILEGLNGEAPRKEQN